MTTKMDVSEDVRELLKTHDFLDLVETGDDATGKRVRVRCALTQHEIVPKKEAIETYLNSKPFRKAKEWYCYDYSQYEPYIVSHRRKPKSLYCNVTDTVLNRIPSEVEKHVNGKKFKRMKEHVKFEIKKTQDEQDEEEFDANEFEFENRQVLNSDDEEEEGVAGAEEDDEELDLELDEEEEAEEDDGDDDMKDLYPDDDVSDDEQVRFIHTAVEKEDGEKKEKKPKKEKKEKKTESKKRKLEDKATAETEKPVEKKSKPTKAPKEPKAAKTEAEAPVVKAKGERPPNKKELRHARKLAAKQQKLQQQAAAEATTN